MVEMLVERGRIFFIESSQKAKYCIINIYYSILESIDESMAYRIALVDRL